MSLAVASLDTNILVRLLTQDDDEQFRLVIMLLERLEGAHVCWTVLLECEWVLRSGYGLKRAEIAEAFLQVVNNPVIQIEGSESLKRALAGYREGMDFADALHLESSAEGVPMVTFDRRFIQKAKALATTGRVLHPEEFPA